MIKPSGGLGKETLLSLLKGLYACESQLEGLREPRSKRFGL